MFSMYPNAPQDLVNSMEKKVRELEEENKKQNIALMRKSADLSAAEEKLKRWQTELEIFAGQKGHNLCWADAPRMLKATLGYTGKYPDPENITGEGFAYGCVDYHRENFADCGFRLKVVKAEDNSNVPE